MDGITLVDADINYCREDDICIIEGGPLLTDMVEEDDAKVWWKPDWKIVRLRFIFDLLLVSIVAIIGITIGL